MPIKIERIKPKDSLLPRLEAVASALAEFANPPSFPTRVTILRDCVCLDEKLPQHGWHTSLVLRVKGDGVADCRMNTTYKAATVTAFLVSINQ